MKLTAKAIAVALAIVSLSALFPAVALVDAAWLDARPVLDVRL
jgi:hypothetical protein